DGDLDAFVSNVGPSRNRVWINDGSGRFSDSLQAIGNRGGSAVALGDLDGDQDLDAFVASFRESSLFLNDGNAVFTRLDLSAIISEIDAVDVELGDLDGDGDLDVVIGGENELDRILLNDGSANFVESPMLVGQTDTPDYALGDFDGDGDLDLFQGKFSLPSRVWTNSCPPANISMSKVSIPPVLQVGSNIAYNLVVSNLSRYPVTGLVVTDTLPAGLVFDPAPSHPACAESNGVVICTLGYLAGGASTRLTIHVLAQPGVDPVITNIAYAAVRNPEPDLSDNQSFAVTLIPDTDADGTPDFVDKDDDNDGTSDEDELRADTDPFDAQSQLTFMGIEDIGAQVRIEWKGGVNVTQFVEKTTSLDDPVAPWMVIFTNRPPTPVSNWLVDPKTSTNLRFYYRIRAR
ncbi:MAG: DUF11 domain-containing protein, partial [Verrucomicrobiota bacterium]